jgi:dipeptidyl aminopeptidase/acylaminoacyl peptidase
MAYATSNKDGFRKVYKVNLKTMQIVGDPIFGIKGYDVGGLIANEAANAIAGVAFTTTKERTRWFDPRLAEVQRLMDEDFGRGNAQILSTNDGDTKILIQIGKVNAPGGYYLFDTESGNLNLVGWAHPIIKEFELNPTESARYKASDGLEIEAVVTYPRHRPSRQKLPVIVIPHGGPFGVRDQEEFGPIPWHQAMAELGYVVIQPNYRGSGGYGKEFEKEGRKPNGYGERMQDDLNDVLTWFGQSGLIDPKRACIMGWSYGGYAAARGAQRDADRAALG